MRDSSLSSLGKPDPGAPRPGPSPKASRGSSESNDSRPVGNRRSSKEVEVRPSGPGSSDPAAYDPRDTPAQIQKPDLLEDREDRLLWVKICLNNKKT